MYWTEVEGYRIPNPVGGHPALDFCNTLAGWDQSPADERHDYLLDYGALAVWAKRAGLIDTAAANRLRRTATREAEAAADVLDETLSLRTSLYNLFLHPLARRPFPQVADLAARAAAGAVLGRDRTGVASWKLPTDLGLELPLLAIARSATELLCSADRLHVRACPARDCGWLFLDRRGRRRWCSMAVCGNRAKVRAHSERRRAGA